MVVLGRSGWFWWYIGWYDLGSRWYDHIRPYIGWFIVYTLLSLYISAALHILHDLLLASVLAVISLLYIENYIFVVRTSNVSKRQYHYNITFSKRYNGRRSLYRPTSGLYYNARSLP
jgi:hypothetical protein